MYEVKEITDKFLWDLFVARSQQGTIFSTTRWLSLYEWPYKLYGCYKNDNLVGGMAVAYRPDYGWVSGGPNHDYIQYSGVLYSNIDGNYPHRLSTKSDILKALIEKIEPMDVYCHPSVDDIRPMKWNGYKADARYTMVLDLDWEHTWDGFEKQMRYKIKAAESKFSYSLSYLADFEELYQMMFDKQGITRPQSPEFNARLEEAFTNKVMLRGVYTEDQKLVSATLYLADNDVMYDIMSATHPDYYQDNPNSVLYWNTFQELWGYRFDFMGTNSESISRYKTGFGGYLVGYVGAMKCSV